LKKNGTESLTECPFAGAVLEQLAFLLEKAMQKLNRFQRKTLGPLGLTGNHLDVLLTLEEKGSISQQEISRCVHIDRSTMVAMIDHLENWGMVERLRNSADRRSYRIFLIAKGKQMIPKAKRLAMISQIKFLSCLTTQDQKVLVGLLRNLVINNFATSKQKENS
jgi:DNA-binding MarR family transcriptional regulator